MTSEVGRESGIAVVIAEEVDVDSEPVRPDKASDVIGEDLPKALQGSGLTATILGHQIVFNGVVGRAIARSVEEQEYRVRRDADLIGQRIDVGAVQARPVPENEDA